MGVDDDIYRPCFQCEDITSRSGVPDYAYTYIDRQSGEAFQVTQPSRGSYVVGQLPDVDEDASCGFHEQCSFAKPDMAQYYVLFKQNVTCPLMILILLDITKSLDIFYCDYATDYMFIYLHCQLPVITFTQKYTQLPKWCNADCNEIVNKTRIYYKK